ncbi:glycosyltransferase 2 [Ancistrocladus abbreviatus]
MGMGNDGYVPLFETKQSKIALTYRILITSMFTSLCLIWAYRATHIPVAGDYGRWAWIGLFASELWLGFHALLSLLLRWNIIYRYTFKDRLSARYKNDLPGVDIFVCTADPVIEPPVLVINTVLSAMAYDYPPEKLSVYLSDDGGSELTYYAMIEASHFAKHWLPFCRKYNVETRSPMVYFRSNPHRIDGDHAASLASIKSLYQEMAERIERITKLGRVPDEVREKHEGFSQWDSYISKNDHSTFLKIVIDRRNPEEKDVEGFRLPTLVYLAREKRPQYFHHFKAGSMNALVRVSGVISNGQIMLNVDCDMYSNSSKTVLDALCFFLDEKNGQRIAYVQFPQMFNNLTQNEIYNGSFRVPGQIELHGLDGCGGSNYIGSGCFIRRDAFVGKEFNQEYKMDWTMANKLKIEGSVQELEQKAKQVASCTYELNTQWGKEMGMKYGIAVEDIVTGLGIQCRGWKSVYFNPERPAYIGLAPTTLAQLLAQQKRWGEGNLQIMLSRYCPLVYGYNRISLMHRFAYCHYHLRAVNSVPTIYYCVVPALYLIRGIPLFPEVSSGWFLPFAYLIFAKCSSSLAEFLYSNGTVKGYWNGQRIWLYKQTSSYLIAFIDTILKLIGLSNMTFAVTAKVSDDDVSKRYEKEIMEFGVSSPMFTILGTLGLLNLFCFGVAMYQLMTGAAAPEMYSTMALQIWLCAVLILINLPLYEAMFLREDKGKMPSSVTLKSVALASLIVFAFFSLFKI